MKPDEKALPGGSSVSKTSSPDLVAAHGFHRSMNVWLENPERMLETARVSPHLIEDDLARTFLEEHMRVYPLLSPQSLAGAIVEPGGRVIASSNVSEAERAEDYIDPAIVEQVVRTGASQVSAV